MTNFYVYSGATPNLAGTAYAGWTPVSADKSITASDGDNLVISGSVNQNVKLYGATADTKLDVTVLDNNASFTVSANNWLSTSVTPNFTVTGNAPSVNIWSGSNATKLSVADNASIGNFTGSNYNDQVTTGTGSHIGAIDTSSGNDTITINGSAGEISAGSGDDSVTVNGTAASIYGQNGEDHITVNGTSGYVDAGGGSDFVQLGNGATTGGIHLGSGGSNGDTIRGGDNVTLNGNLTQAVSEDYSDIVLGKNATINGYVNLHAGKDKLALGSGSVVESSIDMGSDFSADDADTLTIGSGSTIKGYINTNNGDDTVTVGDNTTLLGGWNAINTQMGDDTVILGKGVTATNSIFTGQESDRVIILGDGNYTLDMGLVAPNSDTVEWNYKPGTEAEFNKMMTDKGYTYDSSTGLWYSGVNKSLTLGGIKISNNEYVRGITCFTPGTMIETDRGPVAVETLTVGDMVVTRDRGLQEIRWISRRDFAAAEVAGSEALTPIRISAGALGAGLPAADLVVSPWHRMVIKSPLAAEITGTDEVLIAAVNLLDMAGVERVADGEGVSYIHFMCDQHEMVIANGAATETMNIGLNTAENLSPESYAEILRIFPQLADGVPQPTVRPPVRGAEGRTLVQRHLEAGLPLAC